MTAPDVRPRTRAVRVLRGSAMLLALAAWGDAPFPSWPASGHEGAPVSFGAAPLAAQTTAGADAVPSLPGEWNTPRVLDLVDRARQLRSSTAVDSTFRSYRADARGYVYFFIDRPDADERTLIKADQIALEIYWKAPDLTRQRIVGLRDEKVLPTNIRYHLDHLTVVQDDFGDWIRMGDGDEVERVLHPVGPASEVMYDFRLADSLSIRYGGADDEVRVYEVRVRPRTPDLPGFIGSVFLSREEGAIVRMNFTFTPASYVDPYLDYIRVSLDNSLWEGRWWLPYRQEAEIRREMPALDFLAGSVIRGRFEIGAYEFNEPLDDLFFARRVTSVAQAEREAFPFERGLMDDLETEGLTPTPSLDQVRDQARQIVTDRALSGLPGVRLAAGSVSDWMRYDRAEGLFLGAGARVGSGGWGTVRARGGWAFGRDAFSGAVAFAPTLPGRAATVTLFWDELRDLGPLPGATPLYNSLEAAAGEADHLDPWFARGFRVRASTGPEADRPAVWIGVEEQRSAHQVVGRGLRPVIPVLEGPAAEIGASVPGTLAGGTAVLEGRAVRHRLRTWAGLDASWRWEARPHRTGEIFAADVDLGLRFGEPPVQGQFHLGGRGTLPGIPYRSMSGSHFALVRTSTTLPVAGPWVGVRFLAAAGLVVDLGWGLRTGRVDAPVDSPIPIPALRAASGPVDERDYAARASVGVGLSLLWDVIRIDRARGIGADGSWAWVISVTPRFTPWL